MEIKDIVKQPSYNITSILEKIEKNPIIEYYFNRNFYETHLQSILLDSDNMFIDNYNDDVIKDITVYDNNFNIINLFSNDTRIYRKKMWEDLCWDNNLNKYTKTIGNGSISFANNYYVLEAGIQNQSGYAIMKPAGDFGENFLCVGSNNSQFFQTEFYFVKGDLDCNFNMNFGFTYSTQADTSHGDIIIRFWHYYTGGPPITKVYLYYRRNRNETFTIWELGSWWCMQGNTYRYGGLLILSGRYLTYYVYQRTHNNSSFLVISSGSIYLPSNTTNQMVKRAIISCYCGDTASETLRAYYKFFKWSEFDTYYYNDGNKWKAMLGVRDKPTGFVFNKILQSGRHFNYVLDNLKITFDIESGTFQDVLENNNNIIFYFIDKNYDCLELKFSLKSGRGLLQLNGEKISFEINCERVFDKLKLYIKQIYQDNTVIDGEIFVDIMKRVSDNVLEILSPVRNYGDLHPYPCIINMYIWNIKITTIDGVEYEIINFNINKRRDYKLESYIVSEATLSLFGRTDIEPMDEIMISIFLEGNKLILFTGLVDRVSYDLFKNITTIKVRDMMKLFTKKKLTLPQMVNKTITEIINSISDYCGIPVEIRKYDDIEIKVKLFNEADKNTMEVIRQLLQASVKSDMYADNLGYIYLKERTPITELYEIWQNQSDFENKSIYRCGIYFENNSMKFSVGEQRFINGVEYRIYYDEWPFITGGGIGGIDIPVTVEQTGGYIIARYIFSVGNEGSRHLVNSFFDGFHYNPFYGLYCEKYEVSEGGEGMRRYHFSEMNDTFYVKVEKIRYKDYERTEIDSVETIMNWVSHTDTRKYSYERAYACGICINEGWYEVLECWTRLYYGPDYVGFENFVDEKTDIVVYYASQFLAYHTHSDYNYHYQFDDAGAWGTFKGLKVRVGIGDSYDDNTFVYDYEGYEPILDIDFTSFYSMAIWESSDVEVNGIKKLVMLEVSGDYNFLSPEVEWYLKLRKNGKFTKVVIYPNQDLSNIDVNGVDIIRWGIRFKRGVFPDDAYKYISRAVLRWTIGASEEEGIVDTLTEKEIVSIKETYTDEVGGGNILINKVEVSVKPFNVSNVVEDLWFGTKDGNIISSSNPLVITPDMIPYMIIAEFDRVADESSLSLVISGCNNYEFIKHFKKPKIIIKESCTITQLKIQGKVIKEDTNILVISYDENSINKYGEVLEKISNNYISHIAIAQKIADSYVYLYKEPLKIYELECIFLPHLELDNLIKVVIPQVGSVVGDLKIFESILRVIEIYHKFNMSRDKLTLTTTLRCIAKNF
ncbi:MAG: hypothetical protein QXN68_00835 [Thermoplasmata archaeon]